MSGVSDNEKGRNNPSSNSNSVTEQPHDCTGSMNVTSTTTTATTATTATSATATTSSHTMGTNTPTQPQQHVAPSAPAPTQVKSAPAVANEPVSDSASTNGNKRTTITHDKDGQPLSEKKLRRLEKNRQSARDCRRRKREATEDMQRQINILEGENLRLRLQLQIGEEAEETSLKEQQRVTQSLDELLKSGASESEVYAKIEEYKEKFADYGRDRRSAIEFHLRNVERLLMPTQTTSVIMATLNAGAKQSSAPETADNQPPDAKPAALHNPEAAFPHAAAAAPLPNQMNPGVAAAAAATPATQPAASPAISVPPDEHLDSKSLFRYLVSALEVTQEQAAALKDSRFVAQEMDQCLKKSLTVLKELRTRLTQCGQDLEEEFNIVRSILTPSQAAKFLVWVANNSACMHMLNELWSKAYPEE